MKRLGFVQEGILKNEDVRTSGMPSNTIVTSSV